MAVFIDKELCKSCAMCVSLCPKNVFEITHLVNKKDTIMLPPPVKRIALHARSVRECVLILPSMLNNRLSVEMDKE